QTVAIGLPWHDASSYGGYLNSLDDSAAALAVRQAAAGLFRGAGYTTFTERPAVVPEQSAIGAPYAHVTAPLRRLVDRQGLEICLALSTGAAVPAWVVDGLADLPRIMATSSSIAGRLDSGAVDRVEAALLDSRVGEDLDAVVLSTAKGRARVQLIEPTVTASLAAADARPGTHVPVRVASADIATGSVVLEPA
ncbi:MAG: RNB domain-containing ribonuclease, partial [Leifsonia sp.]